MGGSKNNDEESLLEAIKFYQNGLLRYLERNDEFKMSHGLNKLSSYPIRLSHLKDTGVGRTVNLLVNKDGKVGEQARSLIEKWKKMVEKEEQKQKVESDNKSNNSSPQSSGEENSVRGSPSGKSCSDKNNSSDEEQHSNTESHNEMKIANNTESEESTSDEDRRHNSRKDKRHRSSHDSEEVSPKKHKEHSQHRKEHSSRHSSQNEKQHSSRKDKEHSSRSEKRESSKHKDKEHSSRREKEYSSKHDKRERDDTEKKRSDSTKRKDEKSHKEKERSRHEKNDKSENKEKHERHKEEHGKSAVKEKEVEYKEKEKSSKDKDKKSSSSKGKDDKKSSTKHHITEISSGSGTSFEEAMGIMGMPVKEKKSNSKDKTSNSTPNKHNSSKSSSDESKYNKENKSDKKSSSSKHNDSKKTEREVPKDRKSENKDKSSSSKRNVEEIASGSGTSFEDALGNMELPKKVKREKRKLETETRVGLGNSEYSSSSGTTFEEALGMVEVPRKKKKLLERSVVRSPSPVEDDSVSVPLPSVPLDKIELTSYLPPITPNYKPIALPETRHTHNDISFMDTMMKNKYHRTKIYSGNKSSYNKVPTLLESCINLLKVHIDDIEATGGVPYSILKPVLEKASPTQLLRLEYYNSYLTEDTDELWKLHCQKDFRNKTRQECETWREMYTRCTEEREARFLTLTASIKEAKEKSLPVRTTKVAYIVPPMGGPRNRQSRNSAAPMAKAKAEAISRESMATSDVVVNHQRKASRSQPAASVSSQSKVKKMAPLMAKSLSAFKNRRYKK